MIKYVIIGVVALLAIICVIVVGIYNSLVRLKIQTEEGFATMDVYLKKRFDLIPNLVETVKGYAAHESATLEKVIAARNKGVSAPTAEERVEGDAELTGALKGLFALSESYPDLKANTNFSNLQEQLLAAEEDISQARKYYNAVVKLYNTKCEIFPSSMIARMFHFERKPMFEVSADEQRENVQVKF